MDIIYKINPSTSKFITRLHPSYLTISMVITSHNSSSISLAKGEPERLRSSRKSSPALRCKKPSSLAAKSLTEKRWKLQNSPNKTCFFIVFLRYFKKKTKGEKGEHLEIDTPNIFFGLVVTIRFLYGACLRCIGNEQCCFAFISLGSLEKNGLLDGDSVKSFSLGKVESKGWYSPASGVPRLNWSYPASTKRYKGRIYAFASLCNFAGIGHMNSTIHIDKLMTHDMRHSPSVIKGKTFEELEIYIIYRSHAGFYNHLPKTTGGCIHHLQFLVAWIFVCCSPSFTLRAWRLFSWARELGM